MVLTGNRCDDKSRPYRICCDCRRDFRSKKIKRKPGGEENDRALVRKHYALWVGRRHVFVLIVLLLSYISNPFRIGSVSLWKKVRSHDRHVYLHGNGACRLSRSLGRRRPQGIRRVATAAAVVSANAHTT